MRLFKFFAVAFALASPAASIAVALPDNLAPSDFNATTSYGQIIPRDDPLDTPVEGEGRCGWVEWSDWNTGKVTRHEMKDGANHCYRIAGYGERYLVAFDCFCWFHHTSACTDFPSARAHGARPADISQDGFKGFTCKIVL